MARASTSAPATRSPWPTPCALRSRQRGCGTTSSSRSSRCAPSPPRPTITSASIASCWPSPPGAPPPPRRRPIMPPEDQGMREHEKPDQARVGDIVAGHRIGADRLLLLAWSEEPLPTEGIATLREQRNGKGRLRAHSWQSPGAPPPAAGASWYLLALEIEGAGAAPPGALVALQASGARRPTLARVPEALLDGGEFAARLAAVLGNQQIAVATFLRRVFAGGDGALGPEAGRFLADYFSRVAREDGAIEIVGMLGPGVTMVQGWSIG